MTNAIKYVSVRHRKVERHRNKWDDNIKTDLKKQTERNNTFTETGHWWAFVNTAQNFRLPTWGTSRPAE
jgi:hypothetical protein